MSVAINMARFRLFAKLSTFGIRDSIILFTTCILTVIFDLTYGVIGGIIVTFIANAKNLKVGLTVENEDGDDDITVKATGSLFFINANKLVSELEKHAEAEKATIIRLDLSKVERIDETALEKLATFNKKLKKENKTLILTGENEKTHKRIAKYFDIL